MKTLIDIRGIVTKTDSSELSDKEYKDFIDDFLEVVYNKGYMFSGGFKHLMKKEYLNMNITFPIIKSYNSEFYGLIIEDFSGVVHYWKFEGSYDGFSCDPHIDGNTGTSLN